VGRHSRVRRLGLAILTAALAAPASAVAAGTADSPSGLQPYVDPSFRCPTVHHYGNGKAPDPLTLKGDPLCVVYNKRDITADNGGLIRFLEAEPARFAVAGKCRYWQRDHWRIRIDRGLTTVVGWDGSYWFDLKNGSGGGILRHFEIGGQPASAKQAAAAIRPVSPQLAKQIKRFGAKGGGGGASISFGAGYPQCAIPGA
jgi:hypothetical protein